MPESCAGGAWPRCKRPRGRLVTTAADSRHQNLLSRRYIRHYRAGPAAVTPALLSSIYIYYLRLNTLWLLAAFKRAVLSLVPAQK